MSHNYESVGSKTSKLCNRKQSHKSIRTFDQVIIDPVHLSVVHDLSNSYMDYCKRRLIRI